MQPSKTERQLFHFLKERGPFDQPLLLAFSGGPDSLALFHALLAWGGPFAVAHFDHGWREESCEEAEQLRSFVEERGLPFHLERGEPSASNLEASGRAARYSFFFRLIREKGYRALLLGHHADDRAETLLQRIAEGASPIGLPGLRSVTMREGVEIWRPFLPLSRKEIESGGLDDPSNRDLAFLRARLRHSLLPQMEEAMGKGVRRNLCRFAERSAQWADYLDRKVAPIEKGWQVGPLGEWIDLSKGVDPVEFEHIVRRRLRLHSIVLSSNEIGQMSGRFLVCKGEWTIFVDRGRLFFLKEQEVSWRIEATSGCKKSPGWRGLFSGALSVVVPEGEFSIASGLGGMRRFFSKQKVPHPLWKRVPTVWQGGECVGEFLTGRSWAQGDAVQTISLYPDIAV